MPGAVGEGDRGCLLVSAPGSCWVDNARTSRARDTGRPFWGGRGGGSWWRAVKCVATQGRRCRQRLFGVVVGEHERKLGRRLEGKRVGACGGRKGESPKLESGVFSRILVTTSRLQRLVRGIFSPNNGSVSARSGSWE